MQYRTIVVGSNDVGFKDIERLEQIGLHAADGELGFSGGIVRRIHSENVGIDLVPLESVLQRITTRLSYGLRVDGICLLSCRPYGSGAELLTQVQAIRSFPESLESFPGVFAKTTPIVLSDLQSLIGRRRLESPGCRWLSIVPPARDPSDLGQVLNYVSEAGYDLAFHAMRQWSLDLMEDLEASGLILHRSADGPMHARLALRRSLRGGEMHGKSLNLYEAYGAGLPVFALDIDLREEPFRALGDLLEDKWYRQQAVKDKTKPEILLHRMIEMNPQLVNRSFYKEFITELSLNIRNGVHKSMRPDLILRPIECSNAVTVLELKLPSARTIVRADKGSGKGYRLSRGVIKASDQAMRYARAILDPANQKEVEKKLKRVPEKVSMAILIGLRSPEEPEGQMEELQKDAGLQDIHIIRYNELSQYEMKLWGRESPILRPW
jgi:hypothetical protein